MRNNKLIYICLLVLCASCTKYLDITPKDRFIPTKTKDFENLLNSMVVVSLGDYFNDLKTDDVFLPEENPGNLWAKQRLPARKIYTFESNIYNENETDPLWSEGYKRVFYFNTVIDGVMTSVGGSDAEKKSLRAEALLGRSIEFLDLLNVYAAHYDKKTAATDPGIPMVMRADISEKTKRNTVQEVYDQIIKDVQEAILDLPAQPKLTRYRASIAAGHALLARLYLYQGEYEKGVAAANEALKHYKIVVDMNVFKITIPGPFENVPGSPLGWTDIPNAQHHPESIIARNFLRPFGLGMDVCMSRELAGLFTADDLRWKLYYADAWPPAPPYNYKNLYGVKIYLRGDYFNNAISTPEVYLTRAECQVRLKQLQAGLDDLNYIRQNRIKTSAFTKLTLADVEQSEDKLLRVVLDERRRELAFTGLRLPDLKRLNKEARFSKAITHMAEGKSYTLEPNSNNYLRQLWPAASVFNPEWQLNP